MALPTTHELALTITVLREKANIHTVDALADLLLSAPTFIANFIRSDACKAAATGRHAFTMTMWQHRPQLMT